MYYGPHSIDCLETLWNNASCLSEGDMFPTKLERSQRETLDSMNIRLFTCYDAYLSNYISLYLAFFMKPYLYAITLSQYCKLITCHVILYSNPFIIIYCNLCREIFDLYQLIAEEARSGNITSQADCFGIGRLSSFFVSTVLFEGVFILPLSHQ